MGCLSLHAFSRRCKFSTFAEGEICGGGCEKLFSLKHKDVNFENGLTDEGGLENSFDEIMCLGEQIPHELFPSQLHLLCPMVSSRPNSCFCSFVGLG